MQDDQNYLKISNTLMNNLKNGKVKYSYLVRSSLKELEELTKTFHLSEINEALQKDTGLDLNYNSFWQAYSRFKRSKPNVDISTRSYSPKPQKKLIMPLEVEPELGETANYEWLQNIMMPKELKKIIIDNQMTESEFLKANFNLRNPLMAAKQIIEYISARNSTESCNKIFGNNNL